MEGEEVKRTKTSALYRALVGLAALSGVLIVVVVQATDPIIKENKARALKRAVFSVLPGAETIVTYVVKGDGRVEKLKGEDEKSAKYYAGYSSGGKLVGVAIDAAGQGFQERLRLLFGYSPKKEAIIGMNVLESKETPGLGDKIESDPDFTAQFKALDV
ncbi:MAG: FMN-binding protein, partial [Candidatus Dadabacteria bacterium]